MRKIFQYIVPLLLCICLLNACKKSFNEQQSVPLPPETPDLSTQISQSVSGFVTNENGEAANGASVIAGSKSAITDAYGYFKINDVSLSKTAGFIKISKTGYFDGYRTFVGIENQETFTRIQLVPKTDVGTIGASSGGTVSTADGGIVTLPSNAVVVASTNATYSGTIHVAAHLYNQDDITKWSKAMPGDQRGTDSNEHLQLLKSYGILAVELTGDAGEILQIAAGKEATITTPIPSASVSSAPASIPLWSFNASNGLWKQEGTTTKNGNTYTGNVQHFSFWDGATGVPVVNLTAQIVNNALQPIGNVFVCIRRADDPNIGTTAFTNAQGNVSGAVLANTALILELYSLCDGGTNLVYSQNFSANTTNIDLGTITANLGQLVTITGTVVNCSHAPVTNGWIFIKISNENYRIQIANGSFNFSTSSCSNMNASYVAIDYAAGQQSMAQDIILTPGSNDLGTLTACGTSTNVFLDYAIDFGPTIHVTEPRDSMGFIGTYTLSGDQTNIITIDWDGNPRPNMAFYFFGGTSTGNGHTVDYLESRGFPTGIANTYNSPNTPLVVNISEYGIFGGFIAGSFSGDVEDQGDHSQHHVSCQWRVRRYQ